ncbi:hypothetical protein CFOL_v3_31716 [Cephalotus follicularis]|uniref:Uncharacterized protein n=1 Tax=Cephalotus follicularis TaxID=3775 RepID=A0A1Q3D7J8_CEPFO|nr:hypothetical protein CFOL_v3_31716 [Cephalotus follicularis]
MEAWRHTFLFQNSENRHSWFFCFDKTFNTYQTIPFWFIDWWLYYGPPEDILPPTICHAPNQKEDARVRHVTCHQYIPLISSSKNTVNLKIQYIVMYATK